MCSWNINRHIYDKIKDNEFVSFISDFDIVFLNECWIEDDINIDDNLISDEYNHLCINRKSCKGFGLALIYKKELNGFLSVEKIVHDSILWIKLDKKYARTMLIHI